jgi:hypothetical protein
VNRTEKKVVSGSAQTDWGLSDPAPLSQAIADTLPTGAALTNQVRVGAAYFLLQNGTAYGTNNGVIANLWQLGNAPYIEWLNIARVANQPLLRCATASDPDDHRIFTVDGNTLYTLASPAQVYNFGYHGEPLVRLNAAYLGGATISAALQKNMVKNGSGAIFAADNGTARSFSTSQVRDQWTQSLTIPTVSDNFLLFLPQAGQLTGSIRAGDLAIYAVIGGQKRHINSFETYNSTYAPVTDISINLKEALSPGAAIP